MPERAVHPPLAETNAAQQHAPAETLRGEVLVVPPAHIHIGRVRDEARCQPERSHLPSIAGQSAAQRENQSRAREQIGPNTFR